MVANSVRVSEHLVRWCMGTNDDDDDDEGLSYDAKQDNDDYE